MLVLRRNPGRHLEAGAALRRNSAAARVPARTMAAFTAMATFSPPRMPAALHAYLRWRNQNARHADVLAAQRRGRARIRSEKGIRWGGRPMKVA